GRVVDRGDGRRPPEDRVGRVGLGVEIRVGTAQEPEECVKTTLLWMELGPVAEVPLAEHAGGVPGRLELRGQGRLRECEPELLGRRGGGPRVELVAEPLLITARHEPRTRRAAVGAADVSTGEADAVAGDRVDLGRRDLGVPLTAELAIAEVV